MNHVRFVIRPVVNENTAVILHPNDCARSTALKCVKTPHILSMCLQYVISVHCTQVTVSVQHLLSLLTCLSLNP